MPNAAVVLDHAPDRELAAAVRDAILELFAKDAFLFQADVNERAITHRLALHMTPRFPKWDVDCEYNREGLDPKRVELGRDGTDGSRVFPDIIIHHRNTAENFLVVEVKKSTSEVPDQDDLNKLKALSQQLGYEHALFLKFRAGGILVKPELERVVWCQ